MEYFAIMFSATELVSLTFDNMLTDSEQRIYFGLSVLRPNRNRVTDDGVLLNGRQYSHLLYEHKEWDLLISSNEIDNDDVDFIDNFLSAKFKYIAFYNGSSWEDYIEVLANSGRTPVEYLEGVEFLPEVTLNLRKVEAE